MNPKPSSRRKWILASVKLLIVVLVVWFIHREIARAAVELREHPPEPQAGWLVASGVLYLLAMLPAALFWQRVLHALGQDAAIGQTLRAYFIGHLGKYVPGKAMVVVLRAGLVRGASIDTSLVAVSVFVETLTMMAVGACIAAVILVAEPPDDLTYLLAAVGCMLAVTPPTIPPVFRRLVPLLGVGRANPAIVGKLQGLKATTLLSGWCAMTVTWLVMGVSLWAAIRGIGVGEADLAGNLHRYVAAISLATVVGFVSMMPAGFVTREGALIFMLAPCLGSAAAVSGAVMLRLISVLAELAICGVIYVGGRVGRGTRPTRISDE